MAGERLVNIIKDSSRRALAQGDLADMVWGTVMSINPLRIQVKNEPKLLLLPGFIILSPLCLRKEVIIPETTTSSTEGHSHTIPAQTITLWRGLEVGDSVRMLRVASGNKYYVLQREGNL